MVRRRLSVGASNDPAEREADLIADDVMTVLGQGERADSGAVRAESVGSRVRRFGAAVSTSTEVGGAGGDLGRETVDRIQRARGRGDRLDTATRGRMEGAFKADFGAVRIHRESELAPQISAAAFAHGDDIHFAPGRYQPSSPDGQRLLAHELAHVVQSGRAEAREPVATPGSRIRRANHGLAGRGSEPVRRVYYRENAQRTDAELEYNVLNMQAQSLPALNDVKAKWNSAGKELIMATIERMMSGSKAGSVSAVVSETFGSAGPVKTWNLTDKEEAVRTVLAETTRPRGEAKEKAMAQEVMSGDVTPMVLEGIQRYMSRLATYIEELNRDHYLDKEFSLDKAGEYGSYYQPTKVKLGALSRSMGTVLKDARSYKEIGPLIGALKDISSEFWEWLRRETQRTVNTGYRSQAHDKADASIATPANKSKANYKFIDLKQQEDISTVRPQGQPITEKSQSMKKAREHGMLVEVGPSFSTGRLMQLGTAIKAKPEEMEAVALGIFAFWNQGYWRSMSGIHHYHFVMDMLENYVPGTYALDGYPPNVKLSLTNLLTNIQANPMV
jgi:hypothetical protein